jgi:hypothetical protein
MSDILNLSVKDDTLNNVISGNPYYIDIKGSVNICTIRCGQNIEECNEVRFSTMTNYGKILVLNPDKNSKSKSKCSIKLAFDTNNDTTGINGTGNYNFEKAFITVPSLHKLNGQIYDMETFLLFSSTQKNGNILYVCICTFSNGTSTVQPGDSKLLNYKLINELFSKNVVPDIYGTNQIKGRPNPVDLSNFIPPVGIRNFYDYTHPSNVKVNFRIHQEIMNVSNDILTTLRSKLTPGDVYTNFKLAISQTINPFEGLFFYFSEDLTNRYKSLKNSDNVYEENKENFNDISNEIVKDQEDHEKEVDFKKLDNIKKDTKDTKEEIKENNKDELDENNIEKEKFTDQPETITNNSAIYLFFIIAFLFVVNCFNAYFINNIFTPSNGVSEKDLPNYLNELSDSNMSALIGTKFKFYFNVFLQGIFSLILSIFIPIYITLNNSNSSTKSVYGIIIFLLILILFNVITIIYLNFNYFICNIKGTYDKDFSQKQNYFFGYIKDKMYQGSMMQIISNSIKYTFSNNYDELLRFSPSEECTDNMTGGGDENKKMNPVPGSSLNNINNEKRISDAKSEIAKLSNSPLQNIFKLFSLDIVKKRFEENPKWSSNLKSYLFLLLLFFIIGSVLDLTFISKSNMKGINFLVSLLIVIVSYVPIIFSFATIGSVLVNNDTIKIIILILSGISLILSIFGIPFVKSSAKENWVFWVVIVCFVLNIFLIIIGKLMSNGQLMKGINESSGDGKSSINNSSLEASAPELPEEYLILKKQFDQQEMKIRLYEEELEKLNSNNKRVISQGIGENTEKLKENLELAKKESAKKNEYITKLKDSILNLTNILKKYKLDITKEYLTTISDILENKYGIENLKDEKSLKEDISTLLNMIMNSTINDDKLRNKLEDLKATNKSKYIAFINELKTLKTKLNS